MLCEVSMLLSWISIFGLIKPSAAQAHTNPSCIRIIGDVNGDEDINEYIAQEFHRMEDKDPSLRAKYVSKDEKHQFGYQYGQWFLMAITSIQVKFLRSPPLIVNDSSDLLNPFRIAGNGWKRWVPKETWEPVKNQINVQHCEPLHFPNEKQDSQEDKSKTEPVVLFSTTASLSTTTQPTAQMTRESKTDCIEITTNLTFFANMDDTYNIGNAVFHFEHKTQEESSTDLTFDNEKNTFWLAREFFNGPMKIVVTFDVSFSLYL